MSPKPNTTTIRNKIAHPLTGNKLRRVFVNGKGWFTWNTVYHVYNAATNYEQLRETDRNLIDFSRA